MLNVAVAALILVASPQDDGKSGLGKPRLTQSTASGYVTQAEVKAVGSRMEAVIRNATKLTTKAQPSKLGASDAPATRAQIIGEFSRLYAFSSPAFKVIPAPVQVNAKILKASTPDVKAQLSKMVVRGVIANYGPLAAGPADKLTLKEFGDAVGFFLARIAQMTHMPSTKYSPALMG